MIKKCRQLHLWIGLFTSLLILIEAITGLIMIEPWLVGANHPPTEQSVQSEKAKIGDSIRVVAPVEGLAPQGGDYGNVHNKNNLMGFIRNLHQGRINNTDVSVFLDIAAIGLIILSTTGILLSVRTLKAQFFAENRRE